MLPDAGTIDDAILALLARRAPGATICPSEIARALVPTGGPPGTPNWRDAMPAAHAAIDRLLADGVVRISWKGTALAARSGPYRIARRSQT